MDPACIVVFEALNDPGIDEAMGGEGLVFGISLRDSVCKNGVCCCPDNYVILVLVEQREHESCYLGRVPTFSLKLGF